MTTQRPLFSRDCLSKRLQNDYRTVQDLLDEGVTLNNIPSNSGLLQTDVPEPTPVFIAPRDGKVLSYKNTYIVFGRDRSSTIGSGFGGVGAQHANTIDIVVGRMSSARDGCGVEDGTLVNNSFIADAARIYVSQLTKVDENFGIAGSHTPQHAASAIAVKADGVRIIGREGVKIITGGAEGTAETTSRGGLLRPSPKIDLIAGNFVEPQGLAGKFAGRSVATLQPLLKGTNTKEALQELSTLIDELWSAVYWTAQIQSKVLSTMSACPVGPAPIFGGGGVGPAVSAASSIAANLLSTWVLNPMDQTRATKLMWERNYLQPYGYKYICSKNVRAT